MFKESVLSDFVAMIQIWMTTLDQIFQFKADLAQNFSQS